MYNDPSGHLIGLIGMQVNTACSAIVRNRHAIHVMGMVNGMMNTIINEMVGGDEKEDPAIAFIKGYVVGAGCAAVYYGAAVITVLSKIISVIDFFALADSVIESATNVILAIAYGVTGHRTQMLAHTGLAILCLMDLFSELGLKGKISAKGQKGTVGFECNFKGKGSDTFDYYMDLVETLDVSTAPNTATFYSGKGNRALAEEFANLNGKMTLEITPGGAYLDSLRLFDEASPLTPQEATNVWARLSARYAQGATGNVYGFVNGARSDSIFNTVEYPQLLDNPNVVNIFTDIMN